MSQHVGKEYPANCNKTHYWTFDILADVVLLVQLSWSAGFICVGLCTSFL